MSDDGTSAAVAKKKEEELLESSSSSSGAARKRALPAAAGTTPSIKRAARATLACDGDEDAGASHSSNAHDGYQGFTFSSSSPGSGEVVSEIDRITAADSITPEIFFERYIAARRPCVLKLLPDGSSNNISTTGSKNNSQKHHHHLGHHRLMTLQDLKSLAAGADNDTLVCQVERRPDAQTPFGQNRTMPQYMQELPLTTILERLQDDRTKHLYYLSTQQQQESIADNKSNNKNKPSDNEEDTGTRAAASAFSPLTYKLVQAGLIQDHVPLAGNLILESCHLWMGAGAGGGGGDKSCTSGSNSGSGSSSISHNSGLHHDFHDNFYQLQAGRKRFTLYPPNAAIPVYGQRECIYANGLISYRSNPTRADGVPLSLCQQQKPKTDATAAIINDNDDDSNDKDDDDEEEEVVLGKGFDYQSDTDEEGNGAAGVNFDEDAAVDDYDALCGEQQLNGSDDDSNEEAPKKKAAVAMTAFASTMENGGHEKKQSASSDDDSRRPDSFSPVNLSLDPKELHAAFPIMNNTSLVPPPAIVEIQAGECLYLPASWFHCVESFADRDSNSSGVHMAINYWYHPPDRLDHFADPYHHDFWKRKTQKKV